MGEAAAKGAGDLSEAAAKAEITALSADLRRHSQLYHQDAAPLISDQAYDQRFVRLEALERAWPALREADSPTGAIGWAPVASLTPFPHRRPMLSLGNVFSEADLRDWVEKRDEAGSLRGGLLHALERSGAAFEGELAFMVEPKLDGLAIELVYEGGRLVGAGTRGDGAVGEDVTHTIRRLRSVPLRLKPGAPDYLSVRGEVLFDLAGFEAMNAARAAAGERPFENPRNAAAGTVRQLDPSAAGERPLRFFAHSAGEGI